MADGSVTIGVVLDTAAFSASVGMIQGQVLGLASNVNQTLRSAFSGAVIDTSLISAVNGLASGVLAASASVEQSMHSMASAATSAFGGGRWSAAGMDAAGNIVAGFSSGGGEVVGVVRSVADSAIAAFGNGAWSSIGGEMMAGIASGIRAAGAEVVAAIDQVSGEAENAVKEYYDIRSPSALMRDEVGVMISRGIAEGILSGAGFVHNAVEAVGRGADRMRMSDTVSAAGGSVTQNIYLRDSDASPYKTARRIKRESEAIFRS